MTDNSIGAIVRKAERDYISGKTIISKYVGFSQYETIEKIDAYLNSKHISGEVDALGREKPFFNIVTGACNIWWRATDIDRKDIRIKATKAEDYVGAFLATIHLQEWMKRDSFGQFLNDWGRSLARYGSSVVKFVEKKGKLHAQVVPWNRLISDTIDFEGNLKIEKFYFTPAQLRKNKAYDQEMVEELIECAQKAREGLDRTKKDSKDDYIEIYEVHGEMPLENITGDEDDCETYVQQMHVISFVNVDNKNNKGGKDDKYEDFTLLKGREAKDPYMITHLIKEDGRSLGIGAVEHLFEAQWMTNHTAKAIKDQLDVASKLIFQTADGSFVGQNTLSAIENGDILIHEDNRPLSTVANNSHDVASLQSYGSQWQNLAKEIVSTPDAISGNTMPSGTAYRQVAILNQESHSLFEMMTENKGLAIEAMMREYVIPFLKKQMDTKAEISATLDAHNITQLDNMYVKAEAVKRLNAHVKKHMFAKNGLGGEIAPPFDMNMAKGQIQEELNSTGNQRFLKPSDLDDKTWRDAFANLEWDVEVEVTNEQSDKQAVLATLQTIFQTIGNNPQVLNDPNMKFLFNKILETSGGASPIEIQAPKPVQQAPATPIPHTSIGYKDLSPDLQAQLAEQAGLKTSQQAPNTSPQVGG